MFDPGVLSEAFEKKETETETPKLGWEETLQMKFKSIATRRAYKHCIKTYLKDLQCSQTKLRNNPSNYLNKTTIAKFLATGEPSKNSKSSVIVHRSALMWLAKSYFGMSLQLEKGV